MPSRCRQIFTAIALLLAQPAWAQPAIDSAALQRDIAAGNSLIDVWIGCTRSAAAKLAATSKEGAEVVAVAVFGACSTPEAQFLQHLLRTHMSVNAADSLIEQIRAKIREQVIAQVLTLRAAR